MDKLKAVYVWVVAQIKDLWNRYKGMGLLLLAGVVFLKYRDFLLNLLVNSVKRDVEDATNKAEVLKTQEDAANNAANALIDHANSLDETKKPVTDDWYKK